MRPLVVHRIIRSIVLPLALASPMPTSGQTHDLRVPASTARVSAAADGEWTRLFADIDARFGHSAVYDPARHRMVVFGGTILDENFGDVWSLGLADPPTWTALLPTVHSPYSPSPRYGHCAICDPVRDRMVVFGGANGGPESFGEVWALSLSGDPAWTQWSPWTSPRGGAPDPRESPTAIYDPVRDRMLVFGGSNGSGYVGDVWALSLAGTPTWTELMPSGTGPGGRVGHAAIYDPVRDRMVVFGGASWNGGGGSTFHDDVWALSLADPPTWTQLAPAGTSPCARAAPGAIYDPAGDRIVIYGGADAGMNPVGDAWELAWAEPLVGGVTCPGDAVWTPGSNTEVSYGVTNPYGFAQTVDWTLTGERDWPGLPITGSTTVDAGATASVPVSVLVPDSVAVGLDALTFRALLRGVPQVVSCSHHLHDAATPVQLALVSAQAEPDRVRLTWWAGQGSGVAATVYRRTASAGWSALGRVTSDGSGQIVYEDRAVTPGTRYGYRLGVVDGGAEVFAEEPWVEVPVVPRLALEGVRPNPSAWDLTVAFSLPDGAAARLEAFDLSGRRVVAREVGTLGGGSHVVRFGEDRPLAAGIYLLRLTRAGHSLTTRAVILR